MHRSALICLPFVFLPRWMDKYKRSTVFALIPFFLIYYMMSSSVVEYVVEMLKSDDMYQNYTSAEYSLGVGFLSVVHFIIIIFMFINIQQIEKVKRMYVAVLLAFGLILPLYYYSGMAARLGYYFTVFTIGAYPLFVSDTKLSVMTKVVFTAAIIVITIYNNIMFFADPMWFISFGKYTTLWEAGVL